MAFSDVQIAFQGRPVMAKHKAYSMYRPAAVFIAQTLADMPILFVQLVILDVIVYFMSGLQYDAGKFFTFLLFSFVLTGTITAFFRAAGYATSAYNDATKITGGVFTAFVVVSFNGLLLSLSQYSGYVLYQPSMHPWLSWIRWLNPIFYSIEALLSNELSGLRFECVPRELAPFGAPYAGGPAGCAIQGALPGQTFVTGDAYLASALQFSTSHIWRNFGIVMAWWVAYIVIGSIAIEAIPAAGAARGVTLYKTGSEPAPAMSDEPKESTNLEGMESSNA
jgi:ATP-binding cassette subfamily G (WHITE) protein 2 (SNQ2)